MENGGGGPVDLAGLKPVPPEVAARALAAAEMANGLRCSSCGERIVEGAWIFLLSPAHAEQGVVVQTRRVAACDREECEEFVREAMADATYMQLVRFAWVSDDPADFDG
jgi:hypothetical protein